MDHSRSRPVLEQDVTRVPPGADRNIGAAPRSPDAVTRDPTAAREAVRSLRASKIREVANAGMGRADVLAFWFGEPDEVTPAFIRQAGIDALNAGETFYTHNLGIPELREAIAAYVTRLHRPAGIDRVAVTSSGMSALMLTTQALVGPRDRVVAVTPLWPNLVEIPKILGAEVDLRRAEVRTMPAGRSTSTGSSRRFPPARARSTSIRRTTRPAGRSARASSAPSSRTAAGTASGSSPTTPTSDSTSTGLAAGHAAPSFLGLAEPEDRVVSTNTFSKTWLMTGWRLGWIVAPPELIPDLGKLIEYNTSCAPAFIQRAGVAAVNEGDAVIAHTVDRLRRARDFLHARLQRRSRHRGGVPARRDVCILPRRRCLRQPRLLQAARRRRGTGLGPRHRLRPGRRGLRALVLCLRRGASRRRRRPPAAIPRGAGR